MCLHSTNPSANDERNSGRSCEPVVDVVAPHAGEKVPAPVPKCAAQYSVDVLDSKVGCGCSRSEGVEGPTRE